MKRILRTDKGTVIFDTASDECLYATQCKDKDPKYVRGTDLYGHQSKNGNTYYYALDWSQWHGEEGMLRILSQDDAVKFIQDRVGESGFPNSEQLALLEKYGLSNIFDETG